MVTSMVSLILYKQTDPFPLIVKYVYYGNPVYKYVAGRWASYADSGDAAVMILTAENH